eukprot:1138151-Pelagomonas_calceolata.AAC.3
MRCLKCDGVHTIVERVCQKATAPMPACLLAQAFSPTCVSILAKNSAGSSCKLYQEDNTKVGSFCQPCKTLKHPTLNSTASNLHTSFVFPTMHNTLAYPAGWRVREAKAPAILMLRLRGELASADADVEVASSPSLPGFTHRCSPCGGGIPVFVCGSFHICPPALACSRVHRGRAHPAPPPTPEGRSLVQEGHMCAGWPSEQSQVKALPVVREHNARVAIGRSPQHTLHS